MPSWYLAQAYSIMDSLTQRHHLFAGGVGLFGFGFAMKKLLLITFPRQ